MFEFGNAQRHIGYSQVAMFDINNSTVIKVLYEDFTAIKLIYLKTLEPLELVCAFNRLLYCRRIQC